MPCSPALLTPAQFAQMFDHDGLAKRSIRAVRHKSISELRHEDMGSATISLVDLVEAECEELELDVKLGEHK